MDGRRSIEQCLTVTDRYKCDHVSSVISNYALVLDALRSAVGRPVFVSVNQVFHLHVINLALVVQHTN